MNKKIKVIELFNMLANGDIPEMIKYRCQEYQIILDEYRRLEDNRRLTDIYVLEKILNDEVEILEDECKNEEEIDIQGIEEKDISYVICDSDFEDGCITKLLNSFFKENQKYIDEILKAVKQLDKKINKEE